MHDLKNLIAQLSLVVTNAGKHKHNPRFMDDAITTVDNSVQKMNRLLEHLRSDSTQVQETETHRVVCDPGGGGADDVQRQAGAHPGLPGAGHS